MSIFDLLFIVIFLLTVVTLLFAAFRAMSGGASSARRILGRLAIAWLAYMGVVVVVSTVRPRRVLKIGERRCFDDWCIAVENVEHTTTATRNRYVISFELSSRARRVSQKENGLAVYLVDGRGRRFDPSADVVVPFNVRLDPQQQVSAIRTFDVPADIHEPGVVITHRGGFPITWFIIGEEAWFRKPALVKLT